jgi:putative cardiolipin synthase
MRLNTEIGLIIDSPALARQTAKRFENMVQPENSYAPTLRPDSAGGAPHLVWRTEEGGKPVEYDTEPARDDAQRTKVRLLSLLPLDGEL